MDTTLFVPSSRTLFGLGQASDPAKIRFYNLPTQFTSLIGREQEGATICSFLRRSEVRLLTLTGIGGIGKTRLALQVAANLFDGFANGVCFVSLAAISDPDRVIPTIAQAIGLIETSDQSLFEQLKVSLQDKQLLLLLDNFEHLVEVAPLLMELLAVCPAVKLLVTSRAVLHVRGEYEFPVPPLALPELNHLPELEALSQYAAVALFIQRALAIKPDFQLTKANARAVAEICTRLDGLPLALELAAARIKLLPPRVLKTRLEHRLEVLTSGARDAPLRQQTLRNTIRWSYDLLDAEEQKLFRRLSVFVSGCTLEAAETVCTAPGDMTTQVLDGVASLIDKSLLQQTQQESDEPRLVMLETIREYGLECLRMSGEIELVRHAHADYFLALAQEAEQQLDSTQQAVCLEHLEREHENLRTALHWLEEREQLETALSMAEVLWRFWWMHGHWTEGRNFLEHALTRGKEVASPVKAKALNAAGVLAFFQGDFDTAVSRCEESLRLSRELGDRQGSATSLYRLGQIAWMRSNFEAAHSLGGEALALFRNASDTQGIADALILLGYICMDLGEHVRARLLIEESLALFKKMDNKGGIVAALVTLARVSFFQDDLATAHILSQKFLVPSRETGDKWSIAYAFGVLAYVAFLQSDYAKARSLGEEALAIFKELGNQRGVALGLYGLTWVACGRADDVMMQTLYEESMAIATELGYKDYMALFPQGLAAVAMAQGQTEWAVQLLGAAQAFREGIGIPLPSLAVPSQEQMVAAARSELGEETFARAWSAGQALTPEQAIAAQGRATRSVETSPTTIQPAPVYPAGLTSREVEVLRLVAMGLTNIEVAEKLIISPRTVSTHLSAIFNKLGVTTRSAATRFAAEHRLL